MKNKKEKVEFEIPNSWGNWLNNILENIDIENYIFRIDDDEIHMENHTFLFEESMLNGKEFKKKISENRYYIVCAKIRGYKDKEGIIKENEEDYDIEISIIDNIFIEVYARKEELEKIKLNIEKNKFKVIEENI